MSATQSASRSGRALPDGIDQRLRSCLDRSNSESPCADGRIIFFRADDVAVPGRTFTQLIDLFRSHRAPLTMAVVPAWLTGPRWQRIVELCEGSWDLWGWVQHGWRHLNHESHGKKNEFGPGRSLSRKRKDLLLGLKRLRALAGEGFPAVFSPPWNRCDGETLHVLQELGYKSISRDEAAQPAAPSELPDYAVSVDLHTRKESDPESGWQSLLSELGESVSRGFCGIMIHHQLMDAAAFAFLDLLLVELKRLKDTRLVHLGNLTEEGYGVGN